MNAPSVIPESVWDSATDLNADLTESIPCEWPSCDSAALWRGTSVHNTSDAACCTEHYCGACRDRVEAHIAGYSRPVCRHRQRIHVRWRPLNPARDAS